MIGILGAMPEEVHGMVSQLENRQATEAGQRTYYSGLLFGVPVVVVFSRWGKVAAATTATHLILEYGVRELIFTGVAGAIDPGLRIGDVVIGQHLYQHDMDARPLMPRFEVPLLGRTYFETPAEHHDRALQAASRFLQAYAEHVPETVANTFGIRSPRVVSGNIASGDQFVADAATRHAIAKQLPGIACVEMEGAAAAQVAYEFGIPCTVIRTISDAADESSAVDFPKFIETVASTYSEGIIRELLRENP